MTGINVNPRKDFISTKYGFSSTSKSFEKRSSKNSNFRRSENGYESYDNDFMSTLKRDSVPGDIYIPSNAIESININNYVENLLM